MTERIKVGTKSVDILIQLPKQVYEFYKAYARFRDDPTVMDCLTRELTELIDGIADNYGRKLIISYFNLEEYSTIPTEDL